ncbi:MAG: omp-alpha 4 [Firmicutes bacterium]|nr:omp-alpha 4 [Bacillota bacterium]
MKKVLITLIVSLLMLGITTGALAAVSVNPFNDVPATHWAYEALNKLVKAGIVNGDENGTFNGNRVMSRYEIAVIVANAMTKVDRADAENKALLNKLAGEFASELNSLNVRVAKLEKTAPTFKFYGDFRLRYQTNWLLSASNISSANKAFRLQERARLGFISEVADNVTFESRIIGEIRQSDNNNYLTGAYNDQLEFDKALLIFKNIMPFSDLGIGRQFIQQGPGLLVSIGYLDAAKLTFGKTVKSYIAVGDARYAPGPTYDSSATTNTTAKGFIMMGTQYSVNSKINLYGAGFKSTTNGYNKKLLDAAFDIKLNPDFKLAAEWARNSYNTGANLPDRTASWIGLNYKDANPQKVGSGGFFVNYRKIGANSTDPMLSYVLIDFVPWTSATTFTSFKGMSYGFKTTIAKNSIFQLSMDQLKSFDGAIKYDNAYYAQINVLF